MTTPVVTVAPSTTVHDAAALLAERGFTALPVVDDHDRLVGIVTEADLVRDRSRATRVPSSTTAAGIPPTTGPRRSPR